MRDRGQVAIYLDGKTEPEIRGQDTQSPKRALKSLLVGGSENSPASFEGKIDEVALFDRALGAPEIAKHFAASLSDAPSPPESHE